MTDFIPFPGPLNSNYRRLDSRYAEPDAEVKVVVTVSANNATSDTATDTEQIIQIIPSP